MSGRVPKHSQRAKIHAMVSKDATKSNTMSRALAALQQVDINNLNLEHGKLTTKIDGHATRLQGIDGTVERHGNTLRDLDGSIRTFHSSISANKDAIHAVEKNTETSQELLSKLQQDVARQETGFRSLELYFENFNRQQKETENLVTSLRNEIGQVKTVMATVDSKTKELEQKFDTFNQSYGQYIKTFAGSAIPAAELMRMKEEFIHMPRLLEEMRVLLDGHSPEKRASHHFSPTVHDFRARRATHHGAQREDAPTRSAPYTRRCGLEMPKIVTRVLFSHTNKEGIWSTEDVSLARGIRFFYNKFPELQQRFADNPPRSRESLFMWEFLRSQEKQVAALLQEHLIRKCKNVKRERRRYKPDAMRGVVLIISLDKLTPGEMIKALRNGLDLSPLTYYLERKEAGMA